MLSSKEQTKEWRKAQTWYINGKKNECELFQKRLFETIVQYPINKTNKRLFMIDHSIVSITNPLKTDQGFEYTENFDGEFKMGDTIFLVNFKFTCDQGGAQTRTLREVYHFIKAQNKFMGNYSKEKIYFINILDGDAAYRFKNQFDKLGTTRIFVGDTYEFSEWWKLNFTNDNSL
jgi:hypothetical protein